MTNKNQSVIDGLRAAADWLEQHPDYAALGPQYIYHFVHSVDSLKTAARELGSFDKKADNYHYSLLKSFGVVTLRVDIPREQVCKKIVTWDCGDESLLKEFEGMQEPA